MTNTVSLPKPANEAPAPTVYGMVRAFHEAARFAPVEDWRSHNQLQKEFLDRFMNLGTEADRLPKSMLDAIASSDAAVLNQCLKSHGLTIELQPFGKDGFGAVSVLSLEGRWAGRTQRMTVDAELEYDAVFLNDIEFFKQAGHSEPVVRIFRSEVFDVFVTPWSGDDSGFNAVNAAAELTPEQNAAAHPEDWTSIAVPMLDMDRTSKLDWLLNMSNTNGFKVHEALAQTTLKLDEKGFKVKEGFAFSASRCRARTFNLDKEFLFWVQIPGFTYPLFAVKVGKQYWKNPNK